MSECSSVDSPADKCLKLSGEMDEFENTVFGYFRCNVDDLTRENIVSSKHTKAKLIDCVFAIVDQYRKNNIFNTCSTSKIEKLTDQVQKGHEKIIELQCELLSSKEEQLASLRTAVKEELATVQSVVKTEIHRSWSDVVAKGSNQGSTTLAAAKLKEAVKSAVAEEDKSRNFMIFGKMEAPCEDVSVTVADILHDINEKPRIVECIRIGSSEQGKSRPIKVKLTSSDAVYNVLRSAKHLKNSARNRKTFIGPDRSKEDRAEYKKLVDKMKTMMKEDPEKYHFIRRGGITSVQKL